MRQAESIVKSARSAGFDFASPSAEQCVWFHWFRLALIGHSNILADRGRR
jgi:hypothetical protein